MSDLTSTSIVERVVLWMISGVSDSELATACVAKLNVEPAQAKAVVAEARKRLTLAADYNRDELLGTALTRLNDLYARCIRGGVDPEGKSVGPNIAKALDVQREINRLAGLHRMAVEIESQRGESPESAELAAVGGFLLPLRLCSTAYPLREHARVAAQRITEMAARLGDGGRR